MNRFSKMLLVLPIVAMSACDSRTDADYGLLCAKLHQAEQVRFFALSAAIQERPSLSARTLLEAMQDADKEVRVKLDEIRKTDPAKANTKSYQLELRHFERINGLIRQHGYGRVAQDFKPE